MDRLHAYIPGWEFPKLNPTEHVTDHFGLVSDFLSECWSRLRTGNRVSVMQGRVHLGGALSGRDIEAANKTVSGLTKLLFPGSDMPVSDEDLEWMTRLATETSCERAPTNNCEFLAEGKRFESRVSIGPCSADVGG
jgi:ATP-dependent Lon protease